MNTAATAQAVKTCFFFMWFNSAEELPQTEEAVHSSIDEVVYIPTSDLVLLLLLYNFLSSCSHTPSDKF